MKPELAIVWEMGLRRQDCRWAIEGGLLECRANWSGEEPIVAGTLCVLSRSVIEPRHAEHAYYIRIALNCQGGCCAARYFVHCAAGDCAASRRGFLSGDGTVHRAI